MVLGPNATVFEYVEVWEDTAAVVTYVDEKYGSSPIVFYSRPPDWRFDYDNLSVFKSRANYYQCSQETATCIETTPPFSFSDPNYFSWLPARIIEAQGLSDRVAAGYEGCAEFPGCGNGEESLPGYDVLEPEICFYLGDPGSLYKVCFAAMESS